MRKYLSFLFIVVLLLSSFMTICIFQYNTYAYKTEKVFSYDWLNENILIAHALGGIDGNTYSNCLEAFIENYNNGHRIFEVDLILTSDDYLVARHDWGKPLANLLIQDIP